MDAHMNARALDLSGHVRLPGLINSHDHLEFNLFPRLGRGHYGNATDWARDIHHPERSPIREHLRVPKPVRLWWGALKNLLSGVTTVCHHNPYEPEVFGEDFPVRVVRRMAWAHSLAFEDSLADRFRAAPRTWPFVVHCGEGVDASARRELQTLDRLGALDSRTAIVHGVGLNAAGVNLVRRRGASVIWCPSSNLGMLGRTISRTVFRSDVPVSLATDSAMSAPVDLLDELAVARRFLPTDRLYRMVTSVPARVLRLSERARAGDWIAMRSNARRPEEALFDGRVALVVVGGRIRLISPELAEQLPKTERRRLQPLHVDHRAPVLVDADVAELRRAAAKHLGSDLRLAGKRILA
jgi:cytosine/adenosine deaminase-related metal-dependent hydrolase